MYTIKINTKIKNDVHFFFEKSKIIIPSIDGLEFSLWTEEGIPIKDSSHLCFSCGVFTTLELAQEYETKFLYNIKLFFLKYEVSYVIKSREIFKCGALICSIEFSSVSTSDVNIFIDIINFYNLNINNKFDIALSLFELQHNQNDEKIKFILLMICIESLAIEHKRDNKQLELIESVKSYVENEHSNSANFIIDSLNRLKSIGSTNSCRQIISKYCDEESLKLYNTCSKLRGKLIHNGVADLQIFTYKLSKLVYKLITHYALDEQHKFQ